MQLKTVFILFAIVSSCTGFAQTTPQLLSSSRADTWVATDGIGRRVENKTQHGVRPNKYVGIFYFIWQGAHGYDGHGKGKRDDEGVMEKSPADTVSPYDISKLLAADSLRPNYGPPLSFHYWGEPYFGYYLPDDEWIIRKHAQMLSDAGVDVIIFDVTNSAIYLPQVTKIAETYRAMRKIGLSTPSFAFIVNSNPAKTVNRLYENIYTKGKFKDLWFYWKGKPLLLAPPDDLSEEVKAFFNIRRSWAWTKGQKWFADGKDKWPWIDHTPQGYGWHEDSSKAEQISVAIAEHPVSNIGRSFHDGQEPDIKRPGEGLYFSEQWKRALEVDPEFVFVTGWNEWVAMRFTDGKAKTFLGKPIKPGDTYFVDLYNEEYSRDAEPMKNGFSDNYYYQLVSNVRKYKGARAAPVATGYNDIKIDGKFADWLDVTATFADDKGDITHRNHAGWGRIKAYTNNTGRNDIVETKVATGKDAIFFFARTNGKLTNSADSNWMVLYIGNNSPNSNWLGFRYRISHYNAVRKTMHLETYAGENKWKFLTELEFAKSKTCIELSIPKYLLRVNEPGFVLDFKWCDNVPADGDAMHWLDKGDAAPNGRFAYRYAFQRK